MRALVLLGCSLLPTAAAEEFAVEALKEGAPADVPEAVRRELATAGTRVLRGGKPLVDFWLRAQVPTMDPRSGLNILYGDLVPGSLVGAARYHSGSSDFKAQKFPAGVFTMRYAVQPEDGDHQGVTESRDFLLLCPAAADPSPQVLESKDLNKLSARVNGKKHPAVLYLVKGPEGPSLPRIWRDEGADRVVLECDAPGSAGKRARLWIVIVGKAAEQ